MIKSMLVGVLSLLLAAPVVIAETVATGPTEPAAQ